METCYLFSCWRYKLRHIDETGMSRKFNIKVRLFSGAKISDTHHNLIPTLNKKPDYIVLNVRINHAVIMRQV